jgi:transcription antitermination factor NusB
MRKRTQSREYALQILYQIDLTGESVSVSLENFWQNQLSVDSSVKDFAIQLVNGTVDNIKIIDEKIAKYATNWELDRMATVDRNILRMGIYELLFLNDIPRKVSINEAVDLAKKFSTEESGKFVNGILDTLSQKECPEKP